MQGYGSGVGWGVAGFGGDATPGSGPVAASACAGIFGLWVGRRPRRPCRSLSLQALPGSADRRSPASMTFSSAGGDASGGSPASLLLGGPSPCRDFSTYAAASHQHFRGEASDRANRAHHGEAESREQDRRDGRIPQAPTNGVRTDAQVAAPPKAARRTAASSARDRRRKCDSCTARIATLPASASSIPFVIWSTRSATRARRVENTFKRVAMPDNRKTGVSAT